MSFFCSRSLQKKHSLEICYLTCHQYLAKSYCFRCLINYVLFQNNFFYHLGLKSQKVHCGSSYALGPRPGPLLGWKFLECESHSQGPRFLGNIFLCLLIPHRAVCVCVHAVNKCLAKLKTSSITHNCSFTLFTKPSQLT